MFEKKMFLLNCDVCDARKLKEEDYSRFEQIMINADLLIVSEESKSILNRLPVTANVDETIELDQDIQINLQVVNGKYEIDSNCNVPEYTVLCVNGNLQIMPKTEEILKNYWKIFVNGSVDYPKSLEAVLKCLSINGECNVYPDDCVMLEDSFVVDKYFPLRARENGKYYAKHEVIMGDVSVDLKKLAEKKVQFVTGHVLVLENKVEEAVALFDETVKLTVVSEDEKLVLGDVVLTEKLVAEHGEKLFIHGNMTINEDSASVLNRLQKLTVDGTVFIKKSLEEKLRMLDAKYSHLEILRKVLENKADMTVDGSLLEAASESILLRNMATLKICEDVTREAILDVLTIENCACVYCSPEQRSAIEAVSKNVAAIKTEEEPEEDSEEEGILGILGKMENGFGSFKDTKMVNADRYIL